MHCTTTDATYMIEDGKRRHYPTKWIYDSYGSPQADFPEGGACSQINACPLGEPMYFHDGGLHTSLEGRGGTCTM